MFDFRTTFSLLKCKIEEHCIDTFTKSFDNTCTWCSLGQGGHAIMTMQRLGHRDGPLEVAQQFLQVLSPSTCLVSMESSYLEKPFCCHDPKQAFLCSFDMRVIENFSISKKNFLWPFWFLLHYLTPKLVSKFCYRGNIYKDLPVLRCHRLVRQPMIWGRVVKKVPFG